ncbi:LysR family transcriptional regulator [Psychromonas marina]|uniref:LysR family transcriptional regulator n=1 Tax=Psychromonas marina TaxID=88364 RepID=A0ABQ6E0V5_9GAMM|nr:LysR family transcriptional regulator [Psychromonas marina]GLS90972.1 LysR family transcriptional regulator [Psychromonas marina]
MAKDLFYSLDLNLLRTFMVLSQELNMRKTADRLFVSQPAISQALQKLRNHFDDPLFIKVRTGLEPTAFATSLATKITPYLDGISTTLNASQAFSPADINSTLKIALSPPALTCLSGTLFNIIKKEAPNAQLELVSWTASSPQDIQKGQVLMGVSYATEHLSKEVFTQELVQLTGLLLVRQDHPIKAKTVVPEDLAGYEIAVMITAGWNDNFSYASKILDKYNVDHKVSFRSEHIMALIDVVQHTDMYLPHSNLFPIDSYPTLRAVNVLFEGEPFHYPVYSYMHLKNRNSPLLNWLHSIIKKVLIEQIDQ